MMMKKGQTLPDGAVIRRARRGDLMEYFDGDMENEPSVQAWVGEKDGEILVVGGIARGGDGRWYGFFDIKDGGRCYNILIARWARDCMALFKKQGVKYIYVALDKDERNAARWLKRLGFHVDPRSLKMHRWKNEEV